VARVANVATGVHDFSLPAPGGGQVRLADLLE
jgi:hypothetical protein